MRDGIERLKKQNVCMWEMNISHRNRNRIDEILFNRDGSLKNQDWITGMYVWMDDMQKLGRWMVSRHGKIPFPFSSFLRFFFFASFSSFLIMGQNHRCNSVLHVKQAQPLLQVRFGEGACPVGRPGRGSWFFDG